MFLKPLNLGKFRIETPLALAPMAGVSDSAFREICTAQGAGFTVAEMMTCNVDRWGNDKNRLRQVKPQIDGPHIVQIAGSDPGLMSEAAILNQAMGADIIDINMGCPAKKVLRKAAGSALLKDPALVEEILTAVIAAVDVPVTLKIRTGWCPQSRNGVQIARLAEQMGVQMLSVHGRTRQCRFLGDAEYDTIAAIKQAIDIPVIANGDITSARQAVEVIKHTDADGVMIGRAAQGRPWIFNEIKHYFETGDLPPETATSAVSEIIESHLQKLYALYGDFKGVLFARKHVSSYMKNLSSTHCKHLGDPRQFAKEFNHCTSPQEQVTGLRQFFTGEFKNNKQEMAA